MANGSAASTAEIVGSLIRLWSARPHMMPDATRKHLKAGLRENLLAMRTLVDAAVQREEARRRRRTRATLHKEHSDTAEPQGSS